MFSINRCFVKELKIELLEIPRAGIILYTNYDGKTYFGLGTDRSSHDITDFGGKRNPEENVVNCALREFHEETLGLFEKLINKSVINDCIVFYNYNNLTIFIHIDVSELPEGPGTISSEYLKLYENISATGVGPENCAIIWLNMEDFKKAIQEDNLMYSKMKKFLSNLPDNFIYWL